MAIDDQTLIRVVGCRSDYEVGELKGKIEIDGFKGLTSLDAESLRTGSPDADAKAARFELINAVNAGKHLELSVTANTFKQRKAPNRRYLRLAADKLESRAPSWKNQPYLTDHNTYEMTASKGTISSSKLIEESPGVIAFEQGLHVVTPDAVVGFLNGTFKKFSIGWFALGPVMCTVHDCDVRSSQSCGCWPGDQVAVDGRLKIAEYEFSDYEGKETSTVVVPAVKDTSVSDIRAALAAELNLHPTRPRTRTQEHPKMRFPRLAAALRLAALDDADEGSAVLAVEALERRALAAEQERNALQTKLTEATTKVAQAETALSAAVATGNKSRVDGFITQAYRDGKLGYGRDELGNAIPSRKEARLRRIAAGPNGISELEAELAEMDVVIPVGQRMQSETVPAPGATLGVGASELNDNPYLAQTAAQLGIKVEDMIATYERDMGVGQ